MLCFFFFVVCFSTRKQIFLVQIDEAPPPTLPIHFLFFSHFWAKQLISAYTRSRRRLLFYTHRSLSNSKKKKLSFALKRANAQHPRLSTNKQQKQTLIFHSHAHSLKTLNKHNLHKKTFKSSSSSYFFRLEHFLPSSSLIFSVCIQFGIDLFFAFTSTHSAYSFSRLCTIAFLLPPAALNNSSSLSMSRARIIDRASEIVGCTRHAARCFLCLLMLRARALLPIYVFRLPSQSPRPSVHRFLVFSRCFLFLAICRYIKFFVSCMYILFYFFSCTHNCACNFCIFHIESGESLTADVAAAVTAVAVAAA